MIRPYWPVNSYYMINGFVTSSIQDSRMIEIVGTRYGSFHALGAKRALVLRIFIKCLGASLLHPRNVEHLDNFLFSTNKIATTPCKRRGSQCRLPRTNGVLA